MARTSFAKINLASWRLVLCLSLPAAAGAETMQPAYAPPVPAVSTGSMLQMLAGLLLVLAVIGAAAWLLKRGAANPGTAAGRTRPGESPPQHAEGLRRTFRQPVGAAAHRVSSVAAARDGKA